MKIIKVFLKKSNKSFDIEYSYIVPDDICVTPIKGNKVTIPFGKSNRPTDAYIKEIVNLEEYNKDQNNIPIKSLKNIISIESNDKKDLSEEFINMANWMSRRYICSRSAAMKLMTAPGEDKVSEKKIRKVKLIITGDELKNMINSGNIKKIYQIEILEYLDKYGETEINELTTKFSVSANVINTLIKREYIAVILLEKEIDNEFKNINEIHQDTPKLLNEEQQNAVEELKQSLDSNKYSEYLLHGVTGSGKTEIYLNIIQKVIDMGKSAIVLVPEISLTPQMNARFKARFKDDVAILHSRLSIKDRYNQWQLIKNNKVKLVVGARSAVFAPFSNLGVIIIDEEHEGTYKSETTPKYHAAEIASYRCEYNNALLIHGSATPSMETAYKVQTKQIGYIKLQNRASGIEMPRVELVDMKEEFENGNKGIFSDKLCRELEKNFSNHEQSMILINKRGYSYSLICRNCSYSPQCPSCNTSMTYHFSNGRIICHYCGNTENAPNICPVCGGNELRQAGFGTQRVEKELQEMYPNRRMIRMDMDTTRGKNSHEEILKKFVDEKIDILIGTQMIAKGHDFANVTLMGILSADAGLRLEDFRATEKTFQLITQAAGRAGRSLKEGRVVIQAQNIDDYTITAASKQDYGYFYKREIVFRKQLDFPPYTNMAVIGLSGAEDKYTYDIINDLKNILSKNIGCLAFEDFQILGPARYPMSKMNGKYRWRLIIKCKNINKLIDICAFGVEKISDKKLKNITGPSVDINPVNML